MGAGGKGTGPVLSRSSTDTARVTTQPGSPLSPPPPSAGPLSPAAFLSLGQEADVYLGKAGDAGQGPRCWTGLGPRTEVSGRDQYVPLDPILL